MLRITNGILYYFLALFYNPVCFIYASWVAQTLKNLSAVQETQVQSLGWEDPLEKGMATYSSILAWKPIPQYSCLENPTD